MKSVRMEVKLKQYVYIILLINVQNIRSLYSLAKDPYILLEMFVWEGN